MGATCLGLVGRCDKDRLKLPTAEEKMEADKGEVNLFDAGEGEGEEQAASGGEGNKVEETGENDTNRSEEDGKQSMEMV
jgi:hypothetical protein